MRGFVRPPSKRYTGCFADLPRRSQRAMSTALIATIPIPLRPNAIVLRYMCCHRNSISHGFWPSSSGFRYRSIVCFVTCGASAALPTPTRPSSVKISTTSHPWKVNVPIDACGNCNRSIGFVQKCGGNGTVFPRHRNTRVRISLIFIGSSSRSLKSQSPLNLRGLELWNRDQNDNERDDMKHPSQREHNPVTDTVIE